MKDRRTGDARGAQEQPRSEDEVVIIVNSLLKFTTYVVNFT